MVKLAGTLSTADYSCFFDALSLAGWAALNDQLTAAFAALDWSNGAPRLPDHTTIAAPVAGNLAFDFTAQRLRLYAGGEWCEL